MFKDLINEAKIDITINLQSPLCIKTGDSDAFNPTLPDMQCVKTYKNGEPIYIIPGSSFKGIVRSRYEKLLKLFDEHVCDVTKNKECSNNEKRKNIENNGFSKGRAVYNEMCGACKMFGSGNIASRIKFRDFYPKNEVKTSIRNGVAINRITGASQKGALYEYEVIDSATFQSKILINNFEPKYLKILMYVLRDIDEGYVNLGSSSSRGNGNMKIESLKLELIEYSDKVKDFRLSDIFRLEESNRFEGISDYKCYSKIIEKEENLDMNEFIKEKLNNFENRKLVAT
jgi:CRISPR-associated RAMP protein (TIGR02581 family)